ncbi:hypothetical protein JG688_00007876, partial [Phytophthora aleatoria]
WYSWCSSAQRRHLYRVATEYYDDLLPGDRKTFSVPDDLYEYKDLDKDAAATAIRKIDEVKKVGDISPNFMVSQCLEANETIIIKTKPFQESNDYALLENCSFWSYSRVTKLIKGYEALLRK